MIVDHVWRPESPHNAATRATAAAARPCAYLNCRRPRAEHERSISGLVGRWER